MKKITLVLLLDFLFFSAFSQMPAAIVIEPSNATAYDEITLIFDPTLACFFSGSLAGLPSIGMHSGVTLQSGEIWQYEVAWNETGVNGQANTLYPTGDGKYYITYIPSEFYGLPTGTEATQICAVFNNGTTWDQDGRDFDEYNNCMDFFIPLELPEIFLDLRVFLEGPFVGTEMQTTLNSLGYIPNQQPYNTSPWSYDGDEYVDPIPNDDIVDWILVELRETPWDSSFATTETRIARQAAFLLRDGSVVGTDGTSQITFILPELENYYVFIWHRNHLGVMSSTPLVVSKGMYSYDFTLNENVAYGWPYCLKDLNDAGIYGMIAGSGISDFQVSNEDKNDVWENQNGNTGYQQADYNMNGVVDELDIIDLWSDNAGTGSILPDQFVCGGIYHDQREGQSYRTTQIGNQCWMAENLNLGTMVDSLVDMSDNGMVEKYCYRNEEDSCSKYGGLYQWNELMEYSTIERTQGICPEGWHIPSDTEWKILEGIADSQYGIGDQEWEMNGWRGYDGGKHLKATYSFYLDEWIGTDIYDFTALPAGERNGVGEFWNLGWNSYYYTSTQVGNDLGMYHGFSVGPYIYKRSNTTPYGFCVRCIRDYDNLPPIVPTSPKPENLKQNITDKPVLSWNCLDPENDPLSYDVYFGTTNPPLLVSPLQSDKFYDPGTLNINTTYYWKIIAYDDQGHSIDGLLWRFTTKETLEWICSEPYTDLRNGQTYQTVQIGNQCWMAENMNIGIRIDTSQYQDDNGIFEKYCYDEDEANCDQYGGLYQWDEMMQYFSAESSKGICPEGWHIPSDSEVCTLEEHEDFNMTCDTIGWQGIMGAFRLMLGGTSGFDFLMGGMKHYYLDYYYGLGNRGYLWTSTDNGSGAAMRGFIEYYGRTFRYLDDDKPNAFSVRCLKDRPPTWSCGEEMMDGRDGQFYATVQIGNHCWMAENINIGEKIDGVNNQLDNGTIEKYCFDDQESNCDFHGGLYQWNETMQYTENAGTQGICPEGWHLPTDLEWKILEGTVDSQFGIGNPEWDGTGYRGIDAGKNLKSNAGWDYGGNGLDLYGFTALPAGYRYHTTDFYYQGEYAYYWISEGHDNDNAWKRYMQYSQDLIDRDPGNKESGFSIRCIMDYVNEPPAMPYNLQPENGAIDIEIDTILHWSCMDPEGYPFTYNIYFGIDTDPPFFQGEITDTLFSPGILDYNTTYYWKVVAIDIFGDSTIGNIWSFTTKSDFECGDPILDSRDNHIYNTVQIGNLCWLKESLNIGTMINDVNNQTDNTVIEKWCKYNEPVNCDNYGGLYQWDEMMMYQSGEINQGICPPNGGWHLPTDLEWKILEGLVDSQYDVGDPEWDNYIYRGFDAGLHLKSTEGWMASGNGTDLYGFSAMPGGASYGNINETAFFWTTSLENETDAYKRGLYYDHDNVLRSGSPKGSGLSVRCLKIYMNQPPNLPGDPTPQNGSIDIDIDTTLQWFCSDPKDYPLTYSIYFGVETNPPYVNGNLVDTIFSPGILDYNTTYYWKVVAYDIFGDSTIGNTWSFSTAYQFVCGDPLLDTRDNQVYSTVMIGNQCWMAENINIGILILGQVNAMDNGIIEKYCYYYDENYCDLYGGLYQWNEMMFYQTDEITQGICPDGWHLPTDNEWKILEGTVDSFYGVGDPEWDELDHRGLDVGLNLKSIDGWPSGGNGTDLYGFKSLPGGVRSPSSPHYHWLGSAFYWTTSILSPGPWITRRGLSPNHSTSHRAVAGLEDGFSVRCLHGIPNHPPSPPFNPNPGNGTIDIGIDTTLHWSCSDLDGDDLNYDIYFGADPNPPLVQTDLVDTIFDPGILNYYSLYYWKVIAFDSNGDSTISNIWSFSTKIFACGDLLLDLRDNQVYNTVEIGTQCWMAENLNIGIKIEGVEMTNNGMIEKYCYDNLDSNCNIYGGLYFWEELMQYTTIPGSQGICPFNWHVPTDNEWCTLTQYLDPTVDCNIWGAMIGTDIGLQLKSTHGWNSGGNGLNSSGFGALPAGQGNEYGSGNLGITTFFWTSSNEPPNFYWDWNLSSGHSQIIRNYYFQSNGLSVRCVKD